MKKSAIVRIVIWSFTALLLTGVLIAVMIFGGLKDHFNLPFGIGGFSYENSEEYKAGNASITDTIDTFDINWISGEVTIETYDGDTIDISEDSVQSDDNMFRYLVKNGKLTIQFKKSGRYFNFKKIAQKNLTVKIPKTAVDSIKSFEIDSTSAKISVKDITVAETLSIENVSGDVKIENVTAKEFEADNVSGKFDITNMTADSVDIDTVSGDLNLDGQFNDINTDSTSGKLLLTNAVNPNKLECESTSGDISLKMLSTVGFTAEFDSVSGDFNCEIPFVTKNKNYICGDGSAKFSFDTISADVKISD